jgi:hypothetical protein
LWFWLSFELSGGGGVLFSDGYGGRVQTDQYVSSFSSLIGIRTTDMNNGSTGKSGIEDKALSLLTAQAGVLSAKTGDSSAII